MDTEEKEAQQILKEWIKSDKELLKGMFSGTLLKENKKKDIQAYIKEINKGYLEVEQKRHRILSHSSIQNKIAYYLEQLNWQSAIEVPFGDVDSSYRFDVMAQKGSQVIVVEVKPTVNTRDMGQVLGYVHDIKKKYKKARVFLGTDILNLGIVNQWGEVTDMLLECAEKHGLGIMFVDTNFIFIIPSEFLLA